MSRQKYDWKRFWYPRGGTCILDYAGYLDNPESSYAHITNPEVVPFEAIARTPCLVLLGEPGIGKSNAIDRAFEQVKKQGKPALKFELRGYDSSVELCNEIFGNRVFQDWLNGAYQLNLFLDSLDEGLLSLNVLADILSRKLGNYPCERLQFRITCRTADWKGTLEEDLRRLWGKDNLGVYELAPLRQVDVKKAAEDSNLDSEVFLREIQAREAAPLAIYPITLKFLLKIYQKAGCLPSTKKELYDKGCRNLCDENNLRRYDAGFKGNLDTDERMMIAGRIAAVMVFTNRVAIWRGSDNDASDKDVTIRELCGTEILNGREFQITRTAIEEVLSITGLFSSYGIEHNRFCFSHQTYAEFLAAWYLAQHPMTLVQRMSLVQHPGDPDKKLVPQLHQVAAWLASLVPDMFQEIIETDPDVMLRSDIVTADQEGCAALVETLLKLHNEEKLLYESRSWFYQKLKDKDLIAQIQPYVADITKSVDARYVAIDIARACQMKSLQQDLLNVALDPTQPYWVRVNAAQTVSEIGDSEIKAQLRSLALGEAGDDPDNELKGYGLQATYPSHTTTKEVFDVLTQPKGNYLGGTYQTFIAHDLIEHLQCSDLLLALKWVEAQQPRRELRYPFGDLSDAIMFLAWEHLDSPDILEAFARICFTRWSNNQQITNDRHEPSFESLLLNNDTKRHLLLTTLVSMISPSSEQEPIWILGHRTPVVLQKDFVWMMGQLLSCESGHIQQLWAQLIRRIFREPESSKDEAEMILSVSQTNNVLREVFGFWIKPIELDSPEAEKIRTSYLEEQEWLKRDSKQSEPPLIDRIVLCLNEFESSDLTAWWNLNMEITLMPNSMYHLPIWSQLDITASDGWQTIDSSTKSRIIDAAQKFVENWQRESQGVLNLSEVDAGYKALRLLLCERPPFLLSLNVETWKMWAPVIINTYWASSDSRYVEPHLVLTKLAYQNAPVEVINTLIARIDKENKEHAEIFITRSLRDCWDEHLATTLLKKLEDTALKPKSIGQLLEDLLAHKVFAAKRFAESLIPAALPPSTEESRSKAIYASRALMLYAEDAGWSVIWSAIQQDPEFGREVIELVSYSARETGSIEWCLSEEQVLELYRWISKHYPPVERPKQQEGDEETLRLEDYRTEPRDSAMRWRDTIVQHLKERGTYSACEALRQIADDFPEMAEKLKRTLLEAQLTTRRRTWLPPTPQEVLKVISDQSVRLVNGADQLLDVIVESLDRLNQKLQGETPSAFLLWDQIVSRPKDEQALSDYIKLHLEEDLKQRGIIAKREVEIRRRHGDKGIAALGERVDLQVDAFIRLPNKQIHGCVSAIIEVKGCWNKNLDTAMQTQLVDRYLRDNSCQHGLYLVGWFNCEQWDKEDSRKPPKLNIEEAKQKFEAQAAELSKQGVKVKAVILNTSLRQVSGK